MMICHGRMVTLRSRYVMSGHKENKRLRHQHILALRSAHQPFPICPRGSEWRWAMPTSQALPTCEAVDDFRYCFAYSPIMGGERSSTTRRRLAGKICCAVNVPYQPRTLQARSIALAAMPSVNPGGRFT